MMMSEKKNWTLCATGIPINYFNYTPSVYILEVNLEKYDNTEQLLWAILRWKNLFVT